MTFGEWWRRQSNWKWLGLVVLLWIAIDIPVKLLTGHHGASTSGPVAGPIVSGMTGQDYTFWGRLNTSQRFQLAADCRSQLATYAANSGGSDDSGDTTRQILAFTPARLASGVTSLYSDYSNTIWDVHDACGEVVQNFDFQQQQTQDAQTSAQIEHDISAKQRLLASVANHTFRATTASVSAYMTADSIGYAIRSVDCVNRATCRIAYNDVDPESHPILDRVFGTTAAATPEYDLVMPMTELFKALFSDPRFQQGTLTSWVDLQTVGGRVVKWPALTVSCNRAADAQINWDNITPAGLRQLCSYSLLPAGRAH